jgi:hypothetical protein
MHPDQALILEFEEPTAPRTAAIPPADAESFRESADTAKTSSEAVGGGHAQQQQWVGTSYTHVLQMLYTPAAMRFSGSEASIRASAEVSVALANKAYADSKILLRLNLVAVLQTFLVPEVAAETIQSARCSRKVM